MFILKYKFILLLLKSHAAINTYPKMNKIYFTIQIYKYIFYFMLNSRKT